MVRAMALVVGGLMALSGPAAASGDDLAKRTESSRAAIQKLQGALGKELAGAMEAGGPINAIGACNTKAPAIAADVSKAEGFRVARTSLKTRNDKNAPDAWEKAVLEKFEARKAAGEDPAKIEHAEIVTQGGKKTFRYMKAIPTAEKPCLACHGGAIQPEVAGALDKAYPNDKARGFKAGDLRGAFTISQPVN